jgi:hypothetical protein
MWPSLLKIQYTELKLSCRNDPVVKNYIHSNSDPNINRVLPLPQGNHVAKLSKDPIYRTKVIVQKPVWTFSNYSLTDKVIGQKPKKNSFFLWQIKG